MSLTIRFAGVGLYFAQAVLLARLLGPAGFGELAVAMALVELLAVAALWGMGVYGIREVARMESMRDAAGIHAFFRSGSLTVAGCSLIAIIGLLSVFWMGAALDLGSVLILACPLILPLAIIQLCRGVAQGLGHSLYAQFPGEFLRPMIACAALLALTIANVEVTPPLALIALAAGAAAALLAALMHLYRHLRQIAPRNANPGEATAWRKAAVPHLGNALAQMLHLSLATLMLGALSGPEQAGLFQPVTRIALLLLIPAHAAAVRFAPMVSKLWERGQTKQIARDTLAYTRVTTAMTMTMAIALVPLAPFILLAFGPEFTPGIPMLRTVAMVQVFACAIGPAGWLLAMTDCAGEQLKGYIGALAVQAAVAFWLIPQNGAWGATLALCSGLVALPLFQLPAVWRRIGINCTLIAYRT